MKRIILTVLSCLTLGTLAPLGAQDLTITNARIVVGNGSVIERGSIVVRSGKIASVAAGTPAATAGRTIDAKGMTAMAGFIDAHRHINTGPNEKAQMQAFLEAGYTTILSGGGPAEGNITLRDHIDKGLINGPRIIPSGSLRLNNNTPEMARAEVRKMAAMGIKFTGEIALTPVPGSGEKELEVLRAVVDEAKKAGVMVQVHAVSSKAMVAAVDAGVPLLVHLPNKDWMSKEDAKKLAASGTKILGTVGFGTPVLESLPTTICRAFAMANPGPIRSSTASASARKPDICRLMPEPSGMPAPYSATAPIRPMIRRPAWNTS